MMATMTAAMTSQGSKVRRAAPASMPLRVEVNQMDRDRTLRAAIETLTPTPSAPEWANAESLIGVGNGFGGPY
jgi:hypothetical protein